MDTIYRTLDGSATDREIFEQAGSIILKGGLVAFPTETVYGLGGNALDPKASERIYAAKGRPSDNPLIVHIADIRDLEAIAEDIPSAAYALAERFWAGPLTMILKKKDIVPAATTGGLDTVAVRMPSHPAAAAFISCAGGFVAAPSANLSGRPSPTRAEHVREDLDSRIDMIIDGGSVGIGIESTIVDLTGEKPALLRPGYVTYEELGAILDGMEIDPAVLKKADGSIKPKAPGMKYRHYAPRGELTIVRGKRTTVAEKINSLVKEHSDRGAMAGVIATKESLELYQGGHVKCVGAASDGREVASNLFAVLRAFDDEGIMHIYSEELDVPELGMAVMNRLNKAAGYNYINV